MELEFFFLKLRHENAYVNLVDPKKKSRILTFKHEYLANDCRAYMVNFKRNTGEWPRLDMSSDAVNLAKPIEKTARESRAAISDLIEVELLYRENLDIMARNAGVDFFYAHKFNLVANPISDDIVHLQLSGQEIDHIDEAEDFKDTLNRLIDA